MKFSIRALLLVTVIVALAVGWWVDHQWQLNASSEWKSYAGCLEKIITGAGFDVLRGREWVRSERVAPCVGGVGDVINVRVGNSDTEPSPINPEYIEPYEFSTVSPLPTP